MTPEVASLICVSVIALLLLVAVAILISNLPRWK